MNQRFDDDRTELEAHFQERVRAYIELGETPERAERSAREKFGELEATLRTLRRRKIRRALVDRPFAVLSIGLIWGLLWAALFSAGLCLLQLFLPFDSDVGTIRIALIIGGVGVVSGSLFGVLLSLGERGKGILAISPARAALWGMLSSAVFPLLTHRADQVFWTCPFGALVALAVLALARKAERRPQDPFLACFRTAVRLVVRR